MHVFGLAGWSGSGKTTMMERLLPAINARNVSVSTIKHAHHHFDIDKPGKDSYRHREAGAREVMVSSTRRWVLMHENRGEEEPTADELLSRMSPIDLVIIEGFKSWPHPKLEIHRRGIGDGLLCRTDQTIIAVASDHAIADLPIPVLELDDIDAIADFMLAHLGLSRPATSGVS